MGWGIENDSADVVRGGRKMKSKIKNAAINLIITAQHKPLNRFMKT